jgi:hypothetical protein
MMKKQSVRKDAPQRELDLDVALAALEEQLIKLDQWFQYEPSSRNVSLRCPVPVVVFNQLVIEIAEVVGKRLPWVPEPWFRAVNRKFPKLKLIRRITRIAERACKNTPPRPLLRVMDLESQFGAVAVDFCNLCMTVGDQAGWRSRSVDWQKYALIIKRAHRELFGGPSNGRDFSFRACDEKHGGSDALMLYTAFLEIAHYDVSWAAKYHRSLHDAAEFVRGTLCDSTEPLKRLADHAGIQRLAEIHDNDVNEHRATEKRARAAARQRKRRSLLASIAKKKPHSKPSEAQSEKKDSPKSVTHFGGGLLKKSH